MKKYEILEHTADIGIRIEANDLGSLFRNAALALFDIMAEEKAPKDGQNHDILVCLKAENRDELFVNWLNELLSLSGAKGLIFKDFRIDKIDEREIEAVAWAGDIEDYKVNTEIKAATYHQLKLEESASGWKAEVIFDV